MINLIATPGASTGVVPGASKSSGQGSVDLVSMLLGHSANAPGQAMKLAGLIPGLSGPADGNGAAVTRMEFAELFEAIAGLTASGKNGSSFFGMAVPAGSDPGGDDQPEQEVERSTDAREVATWMPAQLAVGQPAVTIPISADASETTEGVRVHLVIPRSVVRQVEGQDQPLVVDVRGNLPAGEPEDSTDAAVPQVLRHDPGRYLAPVAVAPADPQQAVPDGVQPAEPAGVRIDAAYDAVNVPDLVAGRPISDGAVQPEPVANPDAAQPVTPAEFSWTLTDPVKTAVVESTQPMVIQAQVEDLDAPDKPVESTASAASPQLDAGVKANASVEGAERTPANRTLPEIEQRVIDQVVKEVKLHKFQEGSDLMIRLQPPDLGSLRIRLVSDAQGVTSQIEASTPQVRNLLQAHVPMLMDQLSDAGVRLDSVTVTAAMNTGAWADNMAQQHSQQQTGSPRYRHGAGRVDSIMLNNDQPAAYGLQESAAHSWLA